MLVLVVLILPVSAETSEIGTVVRELPSSVSSGTEFSVTLEITGNGPFAVGIVETIPPGFAFPVKDEDITKSCDFTVDRGSGKVAFSAIGVDQIEYHLISSSSVSSYTFSGNWVDLLYQDTNRNEGKERWEEVTGDAFMEVVSVYGSSGSAFSSASKTSPTEDKQITPANQTTDSEESESNDLRYTVADSNSDVASVAEESTPKTPGFGSIFAFISIMLVYLGTGRREKR